MGLYVRRIANAQRIYSGEATVLTSTERTGEREVGCQVNLGADIRKVRKFVFPLLPLYV